MELPLYGSFSESRQVRQGGKGHGTQLSGEVEENNRNIYCSVYARVNRYGSTGTVEKREKGDCN